METEVSLWTMMQRDATKQDGNNAHWRVNHDSKSGRRLIAFISCHKMKRLILWCPIIRASGLLYDMNRTHFKNKVTLIPFSSVWEDIKGIWTWERFNDENQRVKAEFIYRDDENLAVTWNISTRRHFSKSLPTTLWLHLHRSPAPSSSSSPSIVPWRPVDLPLLLLCASLVVFCWTNNRHIIKAASGDKIRIVFFTLTEVLFLTVLIILSEPHDISL